MSIRTERVGRLIQREIADLLQQDFAGRQQSLVTVTGVRMTDDLGTAYVDVSVLGADDRQRNAAFLRLDQQSTEIRHALAPRVKHLIAHPRDQVLPGRGPPAPRAHGRVVRQDRRRPRRRRAGDGGRDAVARRLLGVVDGPDDLRIVTASGGLSVPIEPAAVLVDKPQGITSFGVIKKVRWAVGVKKVGHAGTLDPMATGLLIVLVGRGATRQQDRFMGLPKVYTGTVRLGQTTASYDADLPVETETDASGVTDDEVAAALADLTGEIMQRPPVYSAIKKGGERLYKKARRGETVEIEPRPTTVTEFVVTERRGDDVDVRVACSKGTYVRSLAHDLGAALGVGGHLTALRREAIGPFNVSEAFALDALVEAARAEAPPA